MQVGDLRGVGTARIDHHQLHVGPRGTGVLDAAEDDRMGVGGIAAGDEQAVGVIDVVVAGRRGIDAERKLVAGDRARHAQPRIGVDVVGPDETLGELVEDVVVLGQPLARAVEGDRVGAVGRDDRGEAPGRVVEGLVPRHPVADLVAARAQFRVERTGLEDVFARGQVQRRPLGAQPAEIGRMLGVAAHTGDAAFVVFDDDAATDAAVATGGSGFGHVCLLPSVWAWSKRHANGRRSLSRRRTASGPRKRCVRRTIAVRRAQSWGDPAFDRHATGQAAAADPARSVTPWPRARMCFACVELELLPGELTDRIRRRQQRQRCERE